MCRYVNMYRSLSKFLNCKYALLMYSQVFIASNLISIQPHIHIIISWRRYLFQEPWQRIEGTAGAKLTKPNNLQVNQRKHRCTCFKLLSTTLSVHYSKHYTSIIHIMLHFLLHTMVLFGWWPSLVIEVPSLALIQDQ